MSSAALQSTQVFCRPRAQVCIEKTLKWYWVTHTLALDLSVPKLLTQLCLFGFHLPLFLI